ncbi:MAG: type II secretion system F family protein [Vibrio sp.]
MQDSWVFLGLLFFSVLLISQALFLPLVGRKAKHKELTKRLISNRNKLDKEHLSLLKEQYLKSLTPFERQLVKWPLLEHLQKNFELAGLGSKFGNGFILALCLNILSVLVCFILNMEWYVYLISVFAPWLILYFYLNHRLIARLNKFEEQLPAALDIMSRMLQAGQPLNQSFHEVGVELEAPIGEEFENTFNLLNYGYDLRMAILQMVDRVPTISMLAFSAAVLLQKETGGNLSENLQNVSGVLRARFKLARKIKTISAESRLSAWILVLSPFGMYLVLTIFNPEYLMPLFDNPIGVQMVGMGALGLFLGAIWIKKIVSFEV